METTGIIAQDNVMRVPYYGSRPIAETGKSDREKQDGGRKDSVVANADDNKGSVLAVRSGAVSGSTSPLPIQRFLTPRDAGNASRDAAFCPVRVATGIKPGYSLNMDTQFVRDQYAINKVVTDMTQCGVNRYREAQAAGLRLISTLEVYA